MASYIYIESEPGLWTVGHHDPDTNKFVPASDHKTEQGARDVVHYLNGGTKADEQMFVPSVPLRDYFAAKAMQSYIDEDPNVADDKIAAKAYATADAMLEARK